MPAQSTSPAKSIGSKSRNPTSALPTPHAGIRARRQETSGPRINRGFTLLEAALVVLILGTLIAGVVTGEELITAARAKTLINQQEVLRVAFFSFQDRFRFLPGDYNDAIRNVGATRDGNGNGRIDGTRESGTENILAWEHLSRAGFIGGYYTYRSSVPWVTAIPTGAYNSFMDMAYDNWYGDPGATNRKVHNIKTGNEVPASILSEVDRKIDDANALSGTFQFSDFHLDGAAIVSLGPAPACVSNVSGTLGQWNAATSPSARNCGAASLL